MTWRAISARPFAAAHELSLALDAAAAEAERVARAIPAAASAVADVPWVALNAAATSKAVGEAELALGRGGRGWPILPAMSSDAV